MNLLNENMNNLLIKLCEFSAETYLHSVRVSKLCVEFGRSIGLKDEDIEKLRIAGLFHDIGKLCIPNQIIHKAGRLSKEEYECVKMHSFLGVRLLIDAKVDDKEILDMVLKHHERPDGLGYPNGLMDDNISYLTSILTICDCYDAMNSKRQYHEKMDYEYINNELLTNSGTQFNSYYVNLFLNFIDGMDSPIKKK